MTPAGRAAARRLAAELARDLEQLVRLAVLQGVLDELRRRESRNPVRARRRRRHGGTGPAAPAKNESETPTAPEPSGETPAPIPRLRVLPKKAPPELGQGDYDPELEAWG